MRPKPIDGCRREVKELKGDLEGVDSWDLIPWPHYNAFVSYVTQIVYKFQISFVINLLNRSCSFTKATYAHVVYVTIQLLAATCFGGTPPSSWSLHQYLKLTKI
jgi:hypothetical protein